MRCSFLPPVSRRLALCGALLFALLADSHNVSATAAGIQFHADLTSLGMTINNKWSSVNEWAYRDNWLGSEYRAPDYFSTHYPFIENVQLMSATGGCFVGYPNCSNVNRDLFVKPSDNATLTDYDFTPLIEAARNIVRQSLKPWIKTGAVPIKFSAHPSISPAFSVNTRPPDDYQAYSAYIKACAQALVDSFGLAEVRTWTWGVLTEFENREWFETDDGLPTSAEVAYFKLYDTTVAALESVIGADHLRVGAHCTAFTPKFWDARTFIDHVAYGRNYATGGQGAHIDYLSFSFYEDAPGVPGNFSATARRLSMAQTLSRLRNRAAADGLVHLQFGIDEGGILAGPDKKGLGRYTLGDSYQGSWDALLFKIMVDNDIAWFSQWDLSSNNVWGGLPYVGAHVATLSYKMTGDRRVAVNKSGAQAYPSDIVDAVAGYSPTSHTFHVMVFNHNPSMLSRQSESVSIVLNHVMPVSGDTVTIRKWQVDDKHGNFWPLWWADMQRRAIPGSHFDYSRYWVEPAIALNDPSDRDFFMSRQAVYAEAAKLSATVEDLTLTGDSLDLADVMIHHSVLFYEISNVMPDEVVLSDSPR